MSDSSARFGLPFLVPGQAQKDVTHNEALALIDAVLGACAEAAGADAAPPSPIVGQCWIVGPAPTGAWAGNAHALAVWTDGGWRFLPAVEGMRAWLKDEQLWATFIDDAWAVGDERVTNLIVGGDPVVGIRQPAVTPPIGGGVIDAEARSAIAAIIARQEAHGLIAVAT